MKIFGYILAVLNVFGAVAFVVVGLMDYAKREAWAYANFTQDVLVQGLPLDKDQLDPYGVPVKDKLGGDTLKAWFPTSPVSTQVEEVARVKKLADAQIAGAGADNETVTYANILTPFALSNNEREYLLGIKTYLGTPEDQAKLRKRLGDAFVLATANYLPRPTSLNFDTAFADACHAVGGVPCPAVEQDFTKYLPAKPEKTFAAAAAAAVKAAPPDPMAAPDQIRYAQAKAFLAELRDYKGVTLRRPNDDPLKTKDSLDDVFQATLQPIHDRLKGQYDGLFDAALTGPKSLAGTSTDRLRDYQREAIARLLFNLVEVLNPPAADQGVTASPDYTRFLAVVGLRRGAHEVEEQAAVLQHVADQLQGARDAERTNFAVAHRVLINDLQERAVVLHDANDLLARKTQELADVQQTVRKRQDDVKNAEADLAAARKTTEEQMAKLNQTSESLNKMRIDGRDVLGENLELEKQIRGLEQKH